ncbi:MAG: RNA polymerase sigma factor [Pyrinomonadaceae bacterium]
MKQWTLSQNSFDQFLSCLDADRDLAGQQYEQLRTRIVKFFEWRSCLDPHSLADEAFDRVIRKIDQGEKINDVPAYLYGVSKLLYLETTKRQRREDPIIIDFPVQPKLEEEDPHLHCLENCLALVSHDKKELILRYYGFDRQAKIDDRKKLADHLGLSINALRIKALRIRSQVEECVMRCVRDEK